MGSNGCEHSVAHTLLIGRHTTPHHTTPYHEYTCKHVLKRSYLWKIACRPLAAQRSPSDSKFVEKIFCFTKIVLLLVCSKCWFVGGCGWCCMPHLLIFAFCCYTFVVLLQQTLPNECEAGAHHCVPPGAGASSGWRWHRYWWCLHWRCCWLLLITCSLSELFFL